ncbi:hemolysin family protein [Streptomyces aidingensis]|uniref:Hemolysin, contains CBS domains n=1 Tax=Streptomyces aidingensis TaxID=910347 RepID=A0A1I1FUT6_9ACTN|nr:hemolysin family protein [Streptomyces aidingensis]SFC00823.1 Hemolysin, contains CBS domains [Streptomyces aidingensis]
MNGSLLTAVAALVFLAWLAACAEAALGRISVYRADEAVRAGRRGAARLAVVAQDPTRYLNLALLLRVAGETAAAVLVTYACLEAIDSGWQALAVAFAVMLLISFVAVGVSPRTIGRQHPEVTSTAAAHVLIPLARVLAPLTQSLILLGNALTPGKGFRQGPFDSEAELRAMVDLAQRDQLIEDAERRMVHSVFELGDTMVREVMVPRTDLITIGRDKTIRAALNLALRSGFSRIPVTGENDDDIVGIVYLKDLARKTHISREAEGERVADAMRPASFVPDTKNAGDLLREMQRDRIHAAVVIDEYGGTAGLITIEDILEEIVGEITDEYDQELPPAEPLGEDRYRVTARLSLDDLGELYSVQLVDQDVETVGGLLAKELGRVPIAGAVAEVELTGERAERRYGTDPRLVALRLTAEPPSGRRNKIVTVLVEPVRREPGPDEEETGAAREDARGHGPPDGGGHPDA